MAGRNSSSDGLQPKQRQMRSDHSLSREIALGRMPAWIFPTRNSRYGHSRKSDPLGTRVLWNVANSYHSVLGTC